jgi:hypothetical protein
MHFHMHMHKYRQVVLSARHADRRVRDREGNIEKERVRKNGKERERKK